MPLFFCLPQHREMAGRVRRTSGRGASATEQAHHHQGQRHAGQHQDHAGRFGDRRAETGVVEVKTSFAGEVVIAVPGLIVDDRGVPPVPPDVKLTVPESVADPPDVRPVPFLLDPPMPVNA